MGERERIDFKSTSVDARYRIFNGSLQINLDSLIKQLANAENLGYTKNKHGMFFIAYVDDKNKCVSQSIFKVRSGTNATNIRTNIIPDKLKNKSIVFDGEIIERQKMAFDNAHLDRWSEEAYLHYFDNIHSRTYGIASVEVFAGSKGIGARTPKAKIKILLGKFLSLGFGRKDVKDYIDWMFRNKYKKYTISLGLLISDGCIQEWAINKKGNVNANKGKINSKFD